MVTLTLIGMAVFAILMLYMTFAAGTQPSISALAGKFKWLLLAALLSQIMLLPQMIEVTPNNWQWMPFLGIGLIVFCGCSNVLDKSEALFHMICAVVAFILMTGWVILMNHYCLFPLLLCLCLGRENLKWRAEVGLIIGVYMTLLLL